MKKNLRILLAIAVLFIVAAVFFGIWKFTRPTANEGEKNITVEVVHKDETVKTFDIQTDREYLADALLGNNIVEDNQDSYGLYILTADGETVNEENQEWWLLSKDGESLTSSASETVISDGDSYQITFTVGYDEW